MKEKIGLDEFEIINLEMLFQNYGRNLYKESIDGNLEVKKEILDVFGATKQGFTSAARILTNDAKVLYARARFFQERGITIDPDRLFMTLGISRKNFEKKYGEYLVDKTGYSDEEYSKRVKMKLLTLYPMPYNIEDMKLNLGVKQHKEREEV